MKPSLWASRVPRDPRYRKPNHYVEMARVAWENRDQLPFAWRILREGVCDGCALGTTGLLPPRAVAAQHRACARSRPALASAAALDRVGTRIHQDVVVTSMMLRPPADTAVIFPATTRYESPGGGTETSTERRIVFSPEVRGRRIGSAKPEWEVFGEVAARVRPDRAHAVRFRSSQEIRDEIARAVPLYAGIERLGRAGDEVQWGGARLFADGRFHTPDGKAHFSVVDLLARERPPGAFYLSTRRGKQFNSMVQRERDPLTDAGRDDVLVFVEDARRLGIATGDCVRLVSATGALVARARLDDIKAGNLEVHWPEGNVLLSRDEIDRASREPDYNALVSLEKLPEGAMSGRRSPAVTAPR